MATVHVTTVEEFKTAIQTANNYVILDNDLDFTNERNISIAGEVTIDGSGQTGTEKHKLSHFFVNNHDSIFEATSSSSYKEYIYFKNCVFDDVLIILTWYHVNQRYFFIGKGGYNSANVKFTNVDLMIKHYLACPSYTSETPYKAIFSGDTQFTKCNVVIDIYYLLPKDFFYFAGGKIQLMEDSIFKFTLYDPNGWGNFNNSGLTGRTTKMTNSAIITEYKSDYCMIPDQSIRISDGIDETDNCYFIFNNTGRFKLTPRIENMRVTTYVFVNSGPADPSAPRSAAESTKINWNIYRPQYSGDSYQLKQLTDEDCKNRATFEDGYPAEGSSPATDPFPFKLKQDYEP
jgi:hypothetical protein